MPAMVTILSPLPIFCWKVFASFAFLACGRIMNNQNTRIIPPRRSNCKLPPPGADCNKITEVLIVLFLFECLCLPFFLLHQNTEVHFIALCSLRVCNHIDFFVIDAHSAFAVERRFYNAFFSRQNRLVRLICNGTTTTWL